MFLYYFCCIIYLFPSYFLYLYFLAGLNAEEKKSVILLGLLFIGAAALIDVIIIDGCLHLSDITDDMQQRRETKLFIKAARDGLLISFFRCITVACSSVGAKTALLISLSYNNAH